MILDPSEALRIVRAVALALLAGAVTVAGGGEVQAKTPGKTYCFLGVCHRVKTLEETERLIGRTDVLRTSYYDGCHRDRFNPCGLTSSGEAFRPEKPDNAASPIYPNGTRLLIWNSFSRKAAVVRVNNAGPYWGTRTLDLSRAAAEHLGFHKQGVAQLHVKVVAAPSKADATYRRNRVYEPVPGPIGAFQDIEIALLEIGRAAHNLFASPVHALAGRQTPQEARAFAAVERRNVEVKVAARTAKGANAGWFGRRGSAGPERSARSAQDVALAAGAGDRNAVELALIEERGW